MSHHFFFEGLTGSPPVGATTFRPGDYTINGMYSSIANAAALYLLDATAEGYAAASDFVIITRGSNSTGTGVLTSAVFDTQGDAGSGSLLATGTGTSNGANALFRVGIMETIIVPASLFTANSTRTGINSGAGNTIYHFVFCSWN